jgi:hypothetical protein
MSFHMSIVPVTAAVMLIILGGCAAPNFGTRAALPRPILLSANDRITPGTRFQIEEVNYKIRQLAEQYEMISSLSLPIP